MIQIFILAFYFIDIPIPPKSQKLPQFSVKDALSLLTFLKRFPGDACQILIVLSEKDNKQLPVSFIFDNKSHLVDRPWLPLPFFIRTHGSESIRQVLGVVTTCENLAELTRLYFIITFLPYPFFFHINSSLHCN